MDVRMSEALAFLLLSAGSILTLAQHIVHAGSRSSYSIESSKIIGN